MASLHRTSTTPPALARQTCGLDLDEVMDEVVGEVVGEVMAVGEVRAVCAPRRVEEEEGRGLGVGFA